MNADRARMFLSQRFGRYTGVMRSDIGVCERASDIHDGASPKNDRIRASSTESYSML